MVSKSTIWINLAWALVPAFLVWPRSRPGDSDAGIAHAVTFRLSSPTPEACAPGRRHCSESGLSFRRLEYRLRSPVPLASHAGVTEQ